MKNTDTLFCILNYKHSENAIKWAESLKNDFAVSILDTYIIDNPDADDPLKNYDGNVLFYHNIFLGGLTIEAFKLCIGGGFKFLCIITSDVEIDEENLTHLKQRFYNLPDDIGIYEVGALPNSCVMGVVGKMYYTRKYFEHSEEEFKEDGLAEGWLYGINRNCIKQLLPHLSRKKNKHAWGVGSALLKISKLQGYRNVIDSNVFVYHPKGTSYDTTEAKYEWLAFDQMSEKIGIPDSFITICFCAKQHNEKYQKYLQSYFTDAMIIVEKICNTDDEKEIAKAYNEVINDSLTNEILFIQENTYFICKAEDEWYTEYVQNLFFRNKEYGIIGNASKFILNDDIITRKNQGVFSFNESFDTPMHYESKEGISYSMEVFNDAIIDGRFFAIRKDRVKSLFNVDEDLPYDAEFCLANYFNGVKIGVTKAFVVNYTKKSTFDKSKMDNLLFKYAGILPIKI